MLGRGGGGGGQIKKGHNVGFSMVSSRGNNPLDSCMTILSMHVCDFLPEYVLY